MSARPPESPPRWFARSWPVIWRIGFAVIVGLSAFALVYGMRIEALAPDDPGPVALFVLMILDVLCAPVAIGLLALRRRAGAGVVIVVLSTFSSLSIGAGVLAVVSFAAARSARSVVALGLLFTALCAVSARLVPDPEFPWWGDVLGAAGAYGVLTLVGVYVRSRRQLLASLRAQAVAARREQEAGAEDARRAERARIAREMHDALGHRLSLIAMHAGALESRADLSPEDTRLAAGVVRQSSHQAMTELRAVLDVLNEPSAARDPGSDLPDLSQLAELVSAGVGHGVVPRLRVEVDAARVPEATSRHLYRMVQEALTNVRKHAPGQATEVTVRALPPDLVELVVRNRLTHPPVPSSGTRPQHGLAGLSERARLAGGRVSSSVDGADFVLRAVLPCRS